MHESKNIEASLVYPRAHSQVADRFKSLVNAAKGPGRGPLGNAVGSGSDSLSRHISRRRCLRCRRRRVDRGPLRAYSMHVSTYSSI